MIAANELRIGNWVKSGKIYLRIDAIISSKYRDLEGIEITPEILEKAGLEKATIENSDLEPDYDLAYITPFARKRLVLEILGNDPDGQINTYWVENVGMREVSLTYDIKYLHELQNLYFALFGEELTINL